MHVLNLIIIDRCGIKQWIRICHREIILKIFPRDDLFCDPVVFPVPDERHVVAVGKPVAVDLINKHPALPETEVQGDSQRQKQNNQQGKSAFELKWKCHQSRCC